MTLRTMLGITAAVAALALGAAGHAAAVPYPEPTVVDPNDYKDGDSVYFSLGNGQNCVIRPNGDVGCDFPQGLVLTIPGFPFRPTVTDLAINIDWLPAHPEFHSWGRAGSKELPKNQDAPGGSTITYAGATCLVGGFHGSWSCKSKGHSFGGGGGYNSIS